MPSFYSRKHPNSLFECLVNIRNRREILPHTRFIATRLYRKNTLLSCIIIKLENIDLNKNGKIPLLGNITSEM